MGVKRELEALNAGGVCTQALTLSTLRGSTTLSWTTSLWSPSGEGRIVFEHGSRQFAFRDDLLGGIVLVIAKTDWARRAFHSPGLLPDA